MCAGAFPFVSAIVFYIVCESAMVFLNCMCEAHI